MGEPKAIPGAINQQGQVVGSEWTNFSTRARSIRSPQRGAGLEWESWEAWDKSEGEGRGFSR